MRRDSLPRQQMQQHRDSSSTKDSRFRAARGTHHSRRQRSALGGSTSFNELDSFERSATTIFASLQPLPLQFPRHPRQQHPARKNILPRRRRQFSKPSEGVHIGRIQRQQPVLHEPSSKFRQLLCSTSGSASYSSINCCSAASMLGPTLPLATSACPSHPGRNYRSSPDWSSTDSRSITYQYVLAAPRLDPRV